MRLHPRTRIVEQAELDLGDFILKLEDKYDLTMIEIIGILLKEALDMKKYALRAERHPNDPDKKGDEE